MITFNTNNFINITHPRINCSFGSRKVSKNGDVFVKGNREKESLMATHPENSNMLEIFDKKTKILPMGMDGVMAVLGNYLHGGMDSQDFASVYLDRTPILFKRIEYGVNKEEYCKSYQPEISLIKAINPLCDDFVQGKTSEQELKAGINTSVKQYVNTEHKRTKIFLK